MTEPSFAKLGPAIGDVSRSPEATSVAPSGRILYTTQHSISGKLDSVISTRLYQRAVAGCHPLPGNTRKPRVDVQPAPPVMARYRCLGYPRPTGCGCDGVALRWKRLPVRAFLSRLKPTKPRPLVSNVAPAIGPWFPTTGAIKQCPAQRKKMRFVLRCLRTW